MNKVFFYTRQQYFKFKSSQLAQGFEFISGSIFYLVEDVDSLDETQQYYVDITSIASLLKVNESQLCFFERLLSNFKDNTTFICDKVYEDDAKYLLMLVYMDISILKKNSKILLPRFECSINWVNIKSYHCS